MAWELMLSIRILDLVQIHWLVSFEHEEFNFHGELEFWFTIFLLESGELEFTFETKLFPIHEIYCVGSTPLRYLLFSLQNVSNLSYFFLKSCFPFNVWYCATRLLRFPLARLFCFEYSVHFLPSALHWNFSFMCAHTYVWGKLC